MIDVNENNRLALEWSSDVPASMKENIIVVKPPLPVAVNFDQMVMKIKLAMKIKFK